MKVDGTYHQGQHSEQGRLARCCVPVFYTPGNGFVYRYMSDADIDWLAIELGHRAADYLRGYR